MTSPLHTVSIRLCERCMAGDWPCGTPNCAMNGVGPLDTSPPLSAFRTDPATGLPTDWAEVRRGASRVEPTAVEADGPCVHGRDDWRWCPHCNGTNAPAVEASGDAAYARGLADAAEAIAAWFKMPSVHSQANEWRKLLKKSDERDDHDGEGDKHGAVSHK